MKRLIAIMLLLCLVLSACGSEETIPTDPIPQLTTEATTEATTEPTTEAAIEATETLETLINPLTGAPTEEPMLNRPIAVVINNIYDAQPLHGVGQADILFEIVAEGGGSITRMVGVYSDISQVPKVGSIRSARTYLIDIAKSFQAVLVHAGGSDYAYDWLNSGKIDHVDGIKESGFYRDQDRKSAGYATEHTLFSSGEKLLKRMQEKGLTLEYKKPADFGYQFAEKPEINGEPANTVKVRFTGATGKGSFFTYDEQLDMYTCDQYFYNKHERPLKDANTDEMLTFRNVIVLKAKTTSDGYRMFAELTGEGQGYFACGGKIVPIQWSRAGEDQPFVYTLEDGTPVTLGIGTTYVGVVSTNSPISYE